MDTSIVDNQKQQEDELLVLRGSFPEDFIEMPPKAWKGAARLPEFAIRVRHPCSNKIFFNLNVKFPKTYPSRVAPIFNVGQPIAGLDPVQIAKLTSIINTEAHNLIGEVSVYSVIGEANNWLVANVPIPRKEEGGISLALQMQKRAEEEERAMKEREEMEAREREEREMQQASELRSQFESDARRKMELTRQEHERRRARRRAHSDATEKPNFEASVTTFENDIVIGDVCFNSVRLYHGRQECLGITYAAEPICEAGECPVQLELHVVIFTTKSYNEQQGRKKLRQLEGEIQSLMKIRNKNILQVYAVQLSIPTPASNEPTRLSILMDKRPPLNLEELLRDCERLREERASDYVGQILRGLQALHSASLFHRHIKPCSIGLVDERCSGKSVKVVKLMKAVFYAKLHDMHRSEPFSGSVKGDDQGDPLSDDWLLRETIDSPLTYTRARDIHALGIVVLQMFLGLDVCKTFPDPATALDACLISPSMAQLVKDLLNPRKRGSVNFVNLFARLKDLSLQHPPRTQPIPVDTMKTPVPSFSPESPETGYFRVPPVQTRKASRWREDWEVLEELGKGAFGSVMKAKNKIDNRIYAVKKIKLNTSTTQNDTKIFREIDALSRLSHRFIVRYYTTWIEEVETLSSNSSNASSDSESGSGDETEVETETEGTVQLADDDSGDPFSYDINELNVDSRRQGSSFPSIMFTTGDVTPADEDDESDGSSMGLAKLMEQASSRGSSSQGLSANGTVTPPPRLLRVMYIQMEYVERLTLQEKINEGISEDEAWRLFQQLVDALVHMSSLGILHRDIKPTNIFIDSNGDCKVGDFGLATQSLVAVDSSDLLHPANLAKHPDMTNNVGTTFYIAPEVLTRRSGVRDHSKADIYSLGIVFFEMNHKMNTGAERINVLQKLRLPEIVFPDDWDTKRTQQKQILQWMLQHNPNERPSALQLSQSPLLPPRIEDEYFKEALQMMTKPDSPHYQAVISALLSQPPRLTRGFLYDEDVPEASSLRRGVIERLSEMFRMHGAREVDTPLLMPLTKALSDEQKRVLLLDSRGEVVTLASNALVPLARLAARSKTTRIKRYHIGDTYREGPALGHPVTLPAAVFDIITPDLINGPQVASAEIISLIHKCLGLFPNLGNNYEILISHSSISEFIMERLTKEQRASVIDIVTQGKSSMAQKRAALGKAGIPKIAIDEIELLYDVYEEWEVLPFRLKKQFPSLYEKFLPYLQEVKKTMELAALAGVTSSILIRPLMIGKRHELYKNGLCFEVVRRTRRSDILATGGRYDHLINQFYPPLVKKDPFCAIGVVIGIERITSSIAAFQSSFMLSNRDQKSYGYWSARRCDVYIVSFAPGHLADRLEVASLLWQNGISADLMYENAVQEKNFEAIIELCSEEGILFTVYPKSKPTKREVTDFKVKSVLRGTEYELSRQDLVPWLQQQISEQRKIDLAASGVDKDLETNLIPSTSVAGISNIISDVSVVLPGDGAMKKHRKQTVKLFHDRAYEMKLRIKNAMHSGGMPMIALDMPPAAFDSISRNNQWLMDDDIWKTTIAGFFVQQTVYANQIRETVLRKKEEGAEYVLLFSVKDERVALLSL